MSCTRLCSGWALGLLLALSALPEDEDEDALVLAGATVYREPDAEPLHDAAVVVRGGKIVEVRAQDGWKPPSGADVIDCAGQYLVAAFQNSHVHFTEEQWQEAGGLSADRLASQFEAMLLRYGFTTVVDTGSDLANTLALRERVESDAVPGPRILTAGGALYPPDGVPYYLKEQLPVDVLSLLHTPRSGEEAAEIVHAQLESGADVLKLFVGSWVERGRVLPMPLDVARPAAARAHKDGRLVFAHASNVAGLEIALEAGVDVLAHALDDDRGWTESHLERMLAADMAMVPTLKLFGSQSYTKYIQAQVGQFAEAGGEILFGTDVGFLTDYDPTEEYELLAGAGLAWAAVLASLTTAPSLRFGEEELRGRVVAGQMADLVLLARDPAGDVTAFADVVLTVRGGRVVYRR